MSEEGEKPARRTLSVSPEAVEAAKARIAKAQSPSGNTNAEQGLVAGGVRSFEPDGEDAPDNHVTRDEIPFIERNDPLAYLNSMYARRIGLRRALSKNGDYWLRDYNKALGSYMHDINDVLQPKFDALQEPIRMTLTFDSPENMEELLELLEKQDLIEPDVDEATGQEIPGFLDVSVDSDIEEKVDNFIESKEEEGKLEVPVCFSDVEQVHKALVYMQENQRKDVLEQFSTQLAEHGVESLSQRQAINILLAVNTITELTMERQIMEERTNGFAAKGVDRGAYGKERVSVEQAEREHDPEGAFRRLPGRYDMDLASELEAIGVDVEALEPENKPSGQGEGRY